MWNYRILEHSYDRKCNTEAGKGQRFYSLVEVYYDEDGKPWGHTGPISFGYMEGSDDVRESLTAAMRDAMKTPVLQDYEVKQNHPWEKSYERDKMRVEILKEEGLWEYDDDELTEEIRSYEIDNWEPPAEWKKKLRVDLGKVNLPHIQISKTGINDPENRDSGNGEQST